MDARFDKIDEQFKTVHQEMAEIKTQMVKQEVELKGEMKALGTELRGEVKNLSTEIQGISKRLDTQEFINRSVMVSFVVAVLAGIIKLFLPQFIS
jgi:uncharacterized protein (DUF849 family)